MRHEKHDPADLLLTSEAARLLGVSGQTIRAWDKRRRLTPAMRTATGIRLYARADLEVMRRALDRERGNKAPAASASLETPSPEAA
jgi:DNA-binding XRE family transcriptional regulator